MEDLFKLTLAVSIPLWTALAVIGVFAAYFAGLAGVGVMFIVIIVVATLWNRTLVSYLEINQPGGKPSAQSGTSEARLRDIESKLDEISRKLKE